AQQTARTYAELVAGDCRVDRYWNDISEDENWVFLNEVRDYCLVLWGCRARPANLQFGLANEYSTLTRGDADLLIEHYLAATVSETVPLSDEELDVLRRDLQGQSRTAIVSDSLDYSRSTCGEGGAQ